jgi:hypothetical protein
VLNLPNPDSGLQCSFGSGRARLRLAGCPRLKSHRRPLLTPRAAHPAPAVPVSRPSAYRPSPLWIPRPSPLPIPRPPISHTPRRPLHNRACPWHRPRLQYSPCPLLVPARPARTACAAALVPHRPACPPTRARPASHTRAGHSARTLARAHVTALAWACPLSKPPPRTSPMRAASPPPVAALLALSVLPSRPVPHPPRRCALPTRPSSLRPSRLRLPGHTVSAPHHPSLYPLRTVCPQTPPRRHAPDHTVSAANFRPIPHSAHRCALSAPASLYPSRICLATALSLSIRPASRPLRCRTLLPWAATPVPCNPLRTPISVSARPPPHVVNASNAAPRPPVGTPVPLSVHRAAVSSPCQSCPPIRAL